MFSNFLLRGVALEEASRGIGVGVVARLSDKDVVVAGISGTISSLSTIPIDRLDY